MKKVAYIIFIGPFLSFIFSCDLATTMELEIPDEKKKLVVNCIFEKDSLVYATI